MTTVDLNPMGSGTAASPLDQATSGHSGGSTSSMAMEDADADDEKSQAAQHRKYDRKSKRFAWPDELHRLFVAAIFDLGLQNASPKTLMSFMMPAAATAGLTSEHLKSHLQKYRFNYDTSRAEFLAFFDESAKRNGKRRRRRTDKPMDRSHTKFIFPINVPSPADAVTDGSQRSVAADGFAGVGHASPLLPQQMRMDAVDGMDQVPAPHAYSQAYAPAYAQLSPRTSNRLERASLLRFAQQNAAMALAMGGGTYGDAGVSPQPMNPSGGGGGDGTFVDIGFNGVSEAQWKMLASPLDPQSPAVNGNSGNTTMRPSPPHMAAFSLNEDTSPDLQMQMHMAMQAQMNLHRQMLTRKVAVSQNYFNQAAAVKRAAASAMVERALQNAAIAQQQQQLQLQQQHSQQCRPSVAAPFGLELASTDPLPLMPPATWDQLDVDMGSGVNSPDDQNEIFSFLKSTEY